MGFRAGFIIFFIVNINIFLVNTVDETSTENSITTQSSDTTIPVDIDNEMLSNCSNLKIKSLEGHYNNNIVYLTWKISNNNVSLLKECGIHFEIEWSTENGTKKRNNTHENNITLSDIPNCFDDITVIIMRNERIEHYQSVCSPLLDEEISEEVLESIEYNYDNSSKNLTFSLLPTMNIQKICICNITIEYFNEGNIESETIYPNETSNFSFFYNSCRDINITAKNIKSAQKRIITSPLYNEEISDEVLQSMTYTKYNKSSKTVTLPNITNTLTSTCICNITIKWFNETNNIESKIIYPNETSEASFNFNSCNNINITAINFRSVQNRTVYSPLYDEEIIVNILESNKNLIYDNNSKNLTIKWNLDRSYICINNFSADYPDFRTVNMQESYLRNYEPCENVIITVKNNKSVKNLTNIFLPLWKKYSKPVINLTASYESGTTIIKWDRPLDSEKCKFDYDIFWDSYKTTIKELELHINSELEGINFCKNILVQASVNGEGTPASIPSPLIKEKPQEVNITNISFNNLNKLLELRWDLGNRFCAKDFTITWDDNNKPLKSDKYANVFLSTCDPIYIIARTMNGDTERTKIESPNDCTDQILKNVLKGILILLLIAIIMMLFLYFRNKIYLVKYRMVNNRFFGPKYKFFVRPLTTIKKMSRNNEDIYELKLKDFKQHYNFIKRDPNIISKEFENLEKISQELDIPVYTANLEENKRKNRYQNILPYDETRVQLKGKTDNNSFYINASYIKGFSDDIEYITTQGPLPSTMDDFWTMVLQENVTVIAMVTQVEEFGKNKCSKYFPKLNEFLIFGEDIEVRVENEENNGFYITRTINISKEFKEVNITHLQYIQWPDFGCPSQPLDLFKYVTQIRKHVETNPGKIIVHCSAGVGRSGTLIAIDILLQHIKSDQQLNIFDTVLELRKQRMKMVQTERQYGFIYDCLYKAIQELNRSSNCSELRSESEEHLLGDEEGTVAIDIKRNDSMEQFSDNSLCLESPTPYTTGENTFGQLIMVHIENESSCQENSSKKENLSNTQKEENDEKETESDIIILDINIPDADNGDEYTNKVLKSNQQNIENQHDK